MGDRIKNDREKMLFLSFNSTVDNEYANGNDKDPRDPGTLDLDRGDERGSLKKGANLRKSNIPRSYKSKDVKEALGSGKEKEKIEPKKKHILKNAFNGDNAFDVPVKDVLRDTYTVEKTLALLVVFTTSYQLLCSFHCRECIALLHRLPRQHFLCGWVQHILGRAYCEVNEYKQASLALREMLRLEPFKVTGTETLSTALWHLKKDKELCSLAAQVIEVDKNCPETWCVVGNCFSLQKEPEVALKYFQRALQVDSTFTYAHTLCGHELANNEDLDKAIQSFRSSLHHDERHYNAWYGLGSVYYRQEKYEMAEYHFRRALAINAVSSVLRCYLSMSLHAQNDDIKSAEALDILILACQVDPKNCQLHYQRAHLLLGQDLCEEAIEALEVVLTLAPKEPPVYSMLGSIHQRLGNTSDALRFFNVAISLDPKESAALKAIIEGIEEPSTTEEIIESFID
jgi:anaphase-promoting complex subunit 3